MALPEQVIAVASFMYDVEATRKSLVEMNPDLEITDEIVMDMIYTWVDEDMQGLEYTLFDGKGNEL